MNIVLAEERGGKQLAEKSFEKESILVGREASECDIAFEKDVYPMVSRRHAEIRWDGRNWFLTDLGSSYGTFLNEQRVASPQELSFGDMIRFGVDGPTIRVIWFEIAEVASPEIAEAKPVEPVRPERPEPIATTHERQLTSAFLESSEDGTTIPLGVQGAWIGREPGCEILIESSPLVSRRHAYIRSENGVNVISDNNSFNGTFVNDQRLAQPAKLSHGDRITLGKGGPVFIYRTSQARPIVEQEPPIIVEQKQLESSMAGGPKTMVAKLGKGVGKAGQVQLVSTIAFGNKNELSIGRAASNDIHLDGLQVSNSHAKLVRSGNEFLIADLSSTNGVFVNGERISKRIVSDSDEITIGSFSLRVDRSGNVGIFDPRSKTRIDAVNLSSSAGKLTLIDSVSFSIQPNEFVGVLGPSGAGKSTLIELLNGVRPPKSGNVLVNNHDLNRNLNALRQSIGYVPQDDIVHRELSVERTLIYVAKLRLPRDVSSKEVRQIVDEVLNVTGLTARRKTAVDKLSGGERKRVSIAVELITRPSIIYADEPTSGLDPSTAERIMNLFREIAESGRTVVMSTHSTDNIRLFDKIAMLTAGKLVYFGPPDEALSHFTAASFNEVFNRLHASAENAAGLKQTFERSPRYKRFVHDPLQNIGSLPAGVRPKKTRLGLFGSIRQFFTLSRRYFEVFRKDRLNLFILIAQAPLIAILTFLAMGSNEPRDFVYFVLALVSIWFGTSISAREIVRERPIYKRERMFNLGILPYLASKFFVLGFNVGIQCLLLFIPLKLGDLLGLMPMPGEYAGIPQLWTMLLTAGVGIALGLLISGIVRTNELATTLVPLILIPQILFSGIIGVPSGLNKVIGLTMPAAWSLDTMKRFSTLDTLEPEGADPRGKTKGLGLYKFVETENERLNAEAKKSIEEYKRTGTFYGGESGGIPDLGEIKTIPEDRSEYVTFLHPWMGDVLNQVVLMLMFGILTILSLIVLRLRDIR